MKERLGNIVAWYTRDQHPITARDLHTHGAMAALLRNALQPNLVQTLEHNVATVRALKYGASEVAAEPRVHAQLARLERDGYGRFPVCIAKTPYSFSDDPSVRGAPVGHTLHVREVRLAAGAEFVVFVCGDIMTMPGLPKVPAATKIDLDANGRIVGLF